MSELSYHQAPGRSTRSRQLTALYLAMHYMVGRTPAAPLTAATTELQLSSHP